MAQRVRLIAAGTLPTGVISLALLSLHIGCATISLGEPHVQSRKVTSSTRAVEVTPQAVAEVRQAGVVATVRAFHVCGHRTTEQVEIATTRERRNDSAAVDWTLGVAGLAAAGVGTGLIIHSGNVHAQDAASREDDSDGQDVAFGTGLGVTALGAALLTIATIDVVRAQGEEADTQAVAVRSPELANLRPCQDHPYAGLPVMVGPHAAGQTGPDGSLEIHLSQHFAEQLLSESTAVDPMVGVIVQNEQIGSVSLAPVADHYARLAEERDRSDWQAVNAEACRTPVTARACSDVERYLSKHPQGIHATAARAFLNAAEPKLRVLRDDAEWERIKSNSVPGCLMPKSEDDCDPVTGYLKEYPNGRHIADAKSVLRRAGPALTALRRERGEEEKARKAVPSVVAIQGIRARVEPALVQNSRRFYLKVTFHATVKRPIPLGTGLSVRAACRVGNARMVDTVAVLGSLDGMHTGDTKALDAVPFFNRPLSAVPGGCSIHFQMGQPFGRAPIQVGRFCHGDCE